MTKALLQQAFAALHPQANRAFVEATKDALRAALAQPEPIDGFGGNLDDAIDAPAPAVPNGAVPPGSWEHLKVMMQHSAWEGTLQLSDALANIDDFAKSAAPAVQESQDERAAFEAWAKSMGLDLYSVVGAQDSANPFGGYTRYAYEAWMARAHGIGGGGK